MLGEGVFSTAGQVNYVLAGILVLLFLGSVLRRARVPLVVMSWIAVAVLPLSPVAMFLGATMVAGILLFVQPDASQLPGLFLAAVAGGVVSYATMLLFPQTQMALLMPGFLGDGAIPFIAGTIAAVLSSFAFSRPGTRCACCAMALVGASVSFPPA